MIVKAAAMNIRDAFIEKSGLITQAEGLPRIAGRVFGMLVFDGEAVSFKMLAERLQVSRASISTSVRLLEERGLVKRVTRPGDRQDYFQIAPNPYATMLEGARKRTRAALNDINETIADLPTGSEARSRLSDYAHFYKTIDAGCEDILDEINKRNQTTMGTQPGVKKEA